VSADKNLLDQIDDLVASKTFNLDALEGIRRLKTDLQKTLDERDSLQRRYDERYKETIRQTDLLRERNDAVHELNKELNAAKALIEAGQKAIYDAEKHQAVADAWKEAMTMVFKPNAVRETVQRQVMKPVGGNPGGNGNYPTPGYLASGTESETTTREEV
jgi:chromosome segregation ATPase